VSAPGLVIELFGGHMIALVFFIIAGIIAIINMWSDDDAD
jgi:uncharacterized membrane protein YuzA (DUF378 family)